MVFTDWVPTLALVALGAGEVWIGLQRAFDPAAQLLQLPTLRAMGRFAKRNILVAGQLIALCGGIPLLFYSGVAQRAGDVAVAIVLCSLAVTAAGIAISQAVWFPMLRGYMEPDQTGRFFGTLRTGWHLALIVYFFGARAWLDQHPGSFAPLFGVGFALGVLRVAMIARLPERSERTGEPIRIREALSLVRTDRRLRSYLLGVGMEGAIRSATLPFVIVMMRRVLGLGEGEVLLTTVAMFSGGLVSLYLWGRVVDRFGAARVFVFTAVGSSLLLASLLAIRGPAPQLVPWMMAYFFVRSVLSAGFGVADTRVLFELSPPEAPARMLVVASVLLNLARALTPVGVGLGVSRWLALGTEPIAVYHVVFGLAALGSALAVLPLRQFGRSANSAPGGPGGARS